MNFVKTPNLPKAVCGVIISPHTPDEIVYNIEKLKIRVLPGAILPHSVKAISAHPDTNILHIKDNLFVTSPLSFVYYMDLLGKYGINLLKGNKTGVGNYPEDIAYNVASAPNKHFHNFGFTDEVILQNLNGILINVKQGYCKCSTVIVDENSIITDDSSIEKAAISNNIDVLKISKGDILLKDLNYGFIGGTCGKLSTSVLAFAGDIKKHSDSSEIIKFCLKKGVEVISLGNSKLIDIGSILPIFEI